MTRSRFYAAMLLGTVVQSGCGDSASVTVDGPMVRDSAGIRLVEYAGPVGVDTVQPSLAWEHGLGAGDYTFRFVFVGALEPDGHVVVGDGGNGEVIRIPPGGEEFEVVARNGQGPAEVARPRGVVADAGGNVWVEDMGNGKIIRFRSGQLMGSVNTGLNPEISRGAMPVDAAPDGDLLMVTASFRSDHDHDWLPGFLTRMPADGTLLDTVASYDMAPRRPPPGSESPFTAFGNATGAGGQWVHTRSDLPELVWRAVDGAVTQVVRWTPELRYPDEAMWDAFEAALRADLVRVNPQMASSRVEEFLNEQVGRYSFDPDTPLPVLGNVTGGSAGDVWVAHFHARGTRSDRYTVFSPDGTETSVVEFDRPVQVLAVSSGRVLALFVDEFDVQAVAVYEHDFGW